MTDTLPRNQAVIKQVFVSYDASKTDFYSSQPLKPKFWLLITNFGLMYKFLSLLARKLQIRHKIGIVKS
ncbi:hypothetical protein CDG79_28525 [Nostoc sp. 'Peltigera membranacea cyanobiont' 232]|nr:hypothetical protein CDG79_28525 [Nostoc sp. 'Peltigera membranacea cyanobiont' 232]